MYEPARKLEPPLDFGFPYTPYDIQQQFMRELFLVLERRQIGIFESPTGTGKSLTLTCGALTWLEQHEVLVREELCERIAAAGKELERQQQQSDKAGDWIATQASLQQQRSEFYELRKLHELLQQHEQKLAAIKERHKKARQQFKQRNKLKLKQSVDAEVVDEFSNDLEDAERETDTPEPTLGDEERFRSVQIFYCSRTHTQLAQIVSELRKTRFGKTMRCVSLASRQQLCINVQVRRLPNVALMNERCLDMAKAKSSAAVKPIPKRQRLDKVAPETSKCDFKCSTTLERLSDATLSDVLDIEDLVSQGQQLAACPYYAARAAQPQAQLVLLPYQLLLHRRARQQNGIDIRGAVIIIDEAHNLLDTLAQIHSCELTLQQLLHARAQITGYKMRYAQRLSTANILKINQLLYVVRRLVKLLEPTDNKATQPVARMLRSYELSAEGDFFNIDLYDLLAFCERTRFAQKLQGYALQQHNEPQPSENKSPATAASSLLKNLEQAQVTRLTPKRKLQQLRVEEQTDQFPDQHSKIAIASGQLASNPIHPLLAFIECLTAHAEDGRVLIAPHADATQAILKYLLLNPSEHFQEIVRDARALIIAGGTMQPTNELTAHLFRGCPQRIQQHFYGHVVPANAVLPFVVCTGPTGQRLCFNYAQRARNEMLKELGMLLQNLCQVVPAGVVCFLPSYEYLESVFAYLQRTGTLECMAQRKRIFREISGSGSSRVEKLLQDYANAIRQPGSGGALLLSVVGGKLSEGLNFADELGRGVIVVGLPYPNRNAPELQERMRYLDVTLGTGAGNDYYENLCMKAVNQCIGRSVRHIRDYASVYLVDERYALARIQQKLPAWIARHIILPAAAFGAIQAHTARFFKTKAKKS